ncbi:hypothetical protein Hokovirus_1_309 [Hokovirus HKV1]|uniref:VWFA domain-containing protein n=1 Tax=Hokovirus HKV1 TaxID=1977638 RepID=A0A1V0SFD6_9VIRU|nr:hypothetical protein Hokovirus_1_309 [Hokovirus HKV1]
MANLNINKILNDYRCQINIENVENNNSVTTAELIIIIDSSGSMGNNTQYLCEKILPNMILKLGYNLINDKHHIIDFNNSTRYRIMTAAELIKNPIFSGGCTYIAPTLKELEKIIQQDQNKVYRVLVISDGDVHDMDKIIESSNITSLTLKSYCMDVHCVRYFTSSSHPDTRALATFLQLNTINKGNLIDINSKLPNDTIVDMLASLFQKINNNVLSSDKPIFKIYPWSEPTNTIHYQNQPIYLTQEPTILFLNDKQIDFTINIKEDIDHNTIYKVMLDDINNYLNRAKILKLVNNPNSLKELETMTNYFNRLEKSMVNDEDVNNSLECRARLIKNMIMRKKKSLLNEFNVIASDDRVSKLNSANMAEWLRTATINKNSKAMARRAFESKTDGDALDFSGILRDEVKKMKNNINELANIDSSDHLVSFYSQASTLDGILALCDMEDDLINELEATDIIQMINIVGLACNSNIGDYPDPMSYRLKNLFPGCYISISDLTFAITYNIKQGSDNNVYVPGHEKTESNIITNVIPLFNDERIHNFLIKYAPNLLEYTASVGMRRMILNINMTYCYTLCSGVWGMVELLNSNKSTIAIETFKNMVNIYNCVADKHFKHITELLNNPPQLADLDSNPDPDQDSNQDQNQDPNQVSNQEPNQDPKQEPNQDQNQDSNQNNYLTYWLNNNGITNIINPVYNIVKNETCQYMANILRSAYSYEASRLMKSYLKKNKYENPAKGAQETLIKFLGIDTNKYGNNTSDLFTVDPEPTFYDRYHINNDMYNTFVQLLDKINYVALLPDLFTSLNCENYVSTIQTLPSLDDNYLAHVFNIKYDIEFFKIATIVQSFLFFNKKARIDDELFKMKIIDLVNYKNAKKLVSNFIVNKYKQYYYNQVIIKKANEKKAMIQNLVHSLINSQTIDEYIMLFKNGLTYNNEVFKIANTSSDGYVDLFNGLLINPSNNIPCHEEKILILWLGKYESKDEQNNNNVWNNGNHLRISLKTHEEYFKKLNFNNTFEIIKQYISEHTSQVYCYREKRNRHNHGNDRPSYYAYGYLSMDEMKNSVTKDFWLEYNNIHAECCGNCKSSIKLSC